MSEFAALAERIIEELLAADPALATSAGDHRYDDRLPDLSTDGVAAPGRPAARRLRSHCPVWTPTTSSRPTGSTTNSSCRWSSGACSR